MLILGWVTASALIATRPLKFHIALFLSTGECESVLLQIRVPLKYCKIYKKSLASVKRCNISTIRLVYLICSFMCAYYDPKPMIFPHTPYLVKQLIKTSVLFINMAGVLILILHIKYDKICLKIFFFMKGSILLHIYLKFGCY